MTAYIFFTSAFSGIEIMKEIGTMIESMGGDGIETVIEIVKEIETGIGTEKGGGMAGKGNAGIETGPDTGAVQGAGIGERETVKMESTVGGVIEVVLVLESVVRMVAKEKNLSARRKRKRRSLEVKMFQIRMIQR